MLDISVLDINIDNFLSTGPKWCLLIVCGGLWENPGAPSFDFQCCVFFLVLKG